MVMLPCHSVGDAALPHCALQFCWNVVAAEVPWVHLACCWPVPVAVGAAAVAAAGLFLQQAAPHSKQLQEFRLDWPAWSATLLLILQPLHQLVSVILIN